MLRYHWIFKNTKYVLFDIYSVLGQRYWYSAK
jgi:hypothetical protein